MVLREKLRKLGTDLLGGVFIEDCDGACDKDPTRARNFAGLCIERERERERERECREGLLAPGGGGSWGALGVGKGGQFARHVPSHALIL